MVVQVLKVLIGHAHVIGVASLFSLVKCAKLRSQNFFNLKSQDVAASSKPGALHLKFSLFVSEHGEVLSIVDLDL